jgi:hypothetical protein
MGPAAACRHLAPHHWREVGNLEIVNYMLLEDEPASQMFVERLRAFGAS